MFLHKEPIKGKMGVAKRGEAEFAVSKIVERAKCQIATRVGDQEGRGKQEAAPGRTLRDKERQQKAKRERLVSRAIENQQKDDRSHAHPGAGP